MNRKQLDIEERTYGSKTLIGNWLEDARLEEELIKDFLEKKDRGELMVQRLGKLKAKMEAPANITPNGDGNLHFGDVVQIMNPGADPNMVLKQRTSDRPPTMLSAITSDSQLITLTHLPAGSNVCGSPSLDPALRNAFKIESCDGTPEGVSVMYGQPLLLVSHWMLGPSLYLTSDRTSFTRSARYSRHQEVFFHEEQCQLTKWAVEYYHPKMRLEFHGSPIPMHEKMIIKHINTNHALTVEPACLSRSIFGMEYEVSCHTYLDDHKAELDVNHWVFSPKHMIGGNATLNEPRLEDPEIIMKEIAGDNC